MLINAIRPNFVNNNSYAKSSAVARNISFCQSYKNSTCSAFNTGLNPDAKQSDAVFKQGLANLGFIYAVIGLSALRELAKDDDITCNSHSGNNVAGLSKKPEDVGIPCTKETDPVREISSVGEDTGLNTDTWQKSAQLKRDGLLLSLIAFDYPGIVEDIINNGCSICSCNSIYYNSENPDTPFEIVIRDGDGGQELYQYTKQQFLDFMKGIKTKTLEEGLNDKKETEMAFQILENFLS